MTGWHAHREHAEQPERFLAVLRSEFPLWGIVYDPFQGMWWALHGRQFTLYGTTGIELRERLIAVVSGS